MLATNTVTTPPNKPRTQQFTQTGVSWENFNAIQQGFADSQRVRLFYYRGELEILSTSPLHEIVKGNIGFLVKDFMLERGIDFVGTGSFSVEKEDVASAQADQSFFVNCSAKFVEASEVLATRRTDQSFFCEFFANCFAKFVGASGVLATRRTDQSFFCEFFAKQLTND